MNLYKLYKTNNDTTQRYQAIKQRLFIKMSNTKLWIPSFEEIKCMDENVTYRNLQVNTEWFRDAVMGDVAEQVFGDDVPTQAIFYNKEKDVFKVVFATGTVIISKPFFDKFMVEDLEEYPGIQEDKNPKDFEGYTVIYKNA